MKYLVNQVEGADDLCQGGLLVVRSLKKRRKGVSKESHVTSDQKTLVAQLTKHLLKIQNATSRGRSLKTGVVSLFFVEVPQIFFLSGLGKRQPE